MRSIYWTQGQRAHLADEPEPSLDPYPYTVTSKCGREISTRGDVLADTLNWRAAIWEAGVACKSCFGRVPVTRLTTDDTPIFTELEKILDPFQVSDRLATEIDRVSREADALVAEARTAIEELAHA